MPQTKYELMAELRELNRGFPRIAISTLKKHEIEARIDALKKYRAQEEESGKLFSPHKPGPLGPRKIPTPVNDNDIKVPGVPSPRVSEYSIKKASKMAREDPEGEFLQASVKKASKMAREDPEGEFLQNSVRNETRVVKKPVKNVRNEESVNPELTRTKSKPAVYEPGCPKCGSTKYHIH